MLRLIIDTEYTVCVEEANSSVQFAAVTTTEYVSVPMAQKCSSYPIELHVCCSAYIDMKVIARA